MIARLTTSVVFVGKTIQKTMRAIAASVRYSMRYGLIATGS